MVQGVFLYADTAAVHGSVVQVQGHVTHLFCGGADDGHYDTDPKAPLTVTLSPSTFVTVIVFGAKGLEHKRIAASDLPAWLLHDKESRIFARQGSTQNTVRFEERYHP